jgi:hypothetical protein
MLEDFADIDSLRMSKRFGPQDDQRRPEDDPERGFRQITTCRQSCDRGLNDLKL